MEDLSRGEETGNELLEKDGAGLVQTVDPADHLGLLGAVASMVAGHSNRTGSGWYVSVAKWEYNGLKMLGADIEFKDVYQEGFFGLAKSAERFDPSKGFKFSTYAVPIIATRSVNSLGSGGYSACSFFPIHFTARQIKDAIHSDIDLPWSFESGSAIYDEEGQVDDEEDAQRIALSVGGEALIPAHDFEDWSQTEVLAQVDDAVLLSSIVANAGLSGREKEVMRLRFGFTERGEMTLEAVGKEFGLTRERIRVIEIGILRKLRRSAVRLGSRV